MLGYNIQADHSYIVIQLLDTELTEKPFTANLFWEEFKPTFHLVLIRQNLSSAISLFLHLSSPRLLLKVHVL